MNTLDWCVLIAAACGVAIGYRRGLVGSLLSVAGLAAAYIAAYLYYDEVSLWLGQFIPWPTFDENPAAGFALKGLHLETYLNNALAFVLIFLVVKLACSGVGALLGIIVRAPGLNFFNKWGGALLGFIAAAILIVVAVNVMGAIPSEPLQRQLSDSKAARFIKENMPAIVHPLRDLWPAREETQV